MSDRSQSQFAERAKQQEATAVAVMAERIPYHPAMQERFEIDRSGWRTLIDAVWPSAKTIEGVILALSYCKARKLDPFKRPVHIVPVYNTTLGREVEGVWPGIGELRTTAVRTGQFAGCDECKFGPEQTERFTGTVGRGQYQRQVDITLTYPAWAQLVVYRMVGQHKVSVPGPKVFWLETYSRMGKSDVPNEQWSKRPYGQLEKCAEAAALRRAFPEEIGNDITDDEITETAPPLVAEEPRDVPTGLKADTTRITQEVVADPVADALKRAESRQGVSVQQPAQQPTARANPVQQPAAKASPTPVQQEEKPLFEAWPADEHGEPAETEAGEPVSFIDPQLFAAWVQERWMKLAPDARTAFLEHNADAIAEAKGDVIAAKMLAVTVEPEPAKEHAAPPDLPPNYLEMPLTPGKKPHWPNYAAQAEAAIGKIDTTNDLQAWINVNSETYAKGCPDALKMKIERALSARHLALTPTEDRDLKSANNFIADINACKTLKELQELGRNGALRTMAERWRQERPELYDMLRKADGAKAQSFGPPPDDVPDLDQRG